ncbi:MAG: hypothetical protein ACYCWW_14780, partial [Deltaproteobacteria bacterium]
GGSELSRRFERQRRLIDGYLRLRGERPGELLNLAERLLSYDRQLALLGLGPDDLPARPLGPALAVASLLRLIAWAALAPLALAGAIFHYPVYRAIGAVASGVAGSEVDMLATVKVLSALVLYPLTWLAAAALSGWRAGPACGAAVLLLAPLSAWLALLLRERWRLLRGGAAAVGLYAFKRPQYERLRAERRAIHGALMFLADPLEVEGGAPSETS